MDFETYKRRQIASILAPFSVAVSSYMFMPALFSVCVALAIAIPATVALQQWGDVLTEKGKVLLDKVNGMVGDLPDLSSLGKSKKDEQP